MTLETLEILLVAACIGAVLVLTGCGSTGEVLPPNIDADELAEIIGPDTSLEDFEGMIATFPTRKKKAIGDAIYRAAEKQVGITEGVKQQIAAYVGPAPGLTELRDELAESMQLAKRLKGRLGVVVDSLKETGVDVAKFTDLLGR